MLDDGLIDSLIFLGVKTIHSWSRGQLAELTGPPQSGARAPWVETCSGASNLTAFSSQKIEKSRQRKGLMTAFSIACCGSNSRNVPQRIAPTQLAILLAGRQKEPPPTERTMNGSRLGFRFYVPD